MCRFQLLDNLCCDSVDIKGFCPEPGKHRPMQLLILNASWGQYSLITITQFLQIMLYLGRYTLIIHCK